MNSKIVAAWSEYNVGLYSTQRPPPLGTVDTVEKLEKLAKEHLVKVANEGTSSGARFSPADQTQQSFNQVHSCMFSEALARGRPTKPTARLSINGLSFPACCETPLPAIWRY